MVVVIDAQIAGISGDMLLSSLVNIGANKSKVIDGIYSVEDYLKGSKITKLDFDKVIKHGIEATHLVLETSENHHERKGMEIQECILSTSDKIGLSEKLKFLQRKASDHYFMQNQRYMENLWNQYIFTKRQVLILP